MSQPDHYEMPRLSITTITLEDVRLKLKLEEERRGAVKPIALITIPMPNSRGMSVDAFLAMQNEKKRIRENCQRANAIRRTLKP